MKILRNFFILIFIVWISWLVFTLIQEDKPYDLEIIEYDDEFDLNSNNYDDEAEIQITNLEEYSGKEIVNYYKNKSSGLFQIYTAQVMNNLSDIVKALNKKGDDSNDFFDVRLTEQEFTDVIDLIVTLKLITNNGNDHEKWDRKPNGSERVYCYDCSEYIDIPMQRTNVFLEAGISLSTGEGVANLLGGPGLVALVADLKNILEVSESSVYYNTYTVSKDSACEKYCYD